jgi:hypothetical protein
LSALGGPLLGIDGLLTQRAEIQRDQSTVDDAGGKTARDWETLATVDSFMWWGSGATITRMGQIQGHPEATTDVNIGGMLMPQGTDVTARDRIGAVTDDAGNTIEPGPLEIIAVSNFEGITEVTFRRFT